MATRDELQMSMRMPMDMGFGPTYSPLYLQYINQLEGMFKRLGEAQASDLGTMETDFSAASQLANEGFEQERLRIASEPNPTAQRPAWQTGIGALLGGKTEGFQVAEDERRRAFETQRSERLNQLQVARLEKLAAAAEKMGDLVRAHKYGSEARKVQAEITERLGMAKAAAGDESAGMRAEIAARGGMLEALLRLAAAQTEKGKSKLLTDAEYALEWENTVDEFTKAGGGIKNYDTLLSALAGFRSENQTPKTWMAKLLTAKVGGKPLLKTDGKGNIKDAHQKQLLAIIRSTIFTDEEIEKDYPSGGAPVVKPPAVSTATPVGPLEFAKARYNELQKQYSQLSSRIYAGEQGIPTSDFVELRKKLDKARKEVEALSPKPEAAPGRRTIAPGRNY